MNSAIVKFEPEVLSRFWSKVDRSGDCWEFRGTILTSGYGQVKERHHAAAMKRQDDLLAAWRNPSGSRAAA